jgi:hypothetical protein
MRFARLITKATYAHTEYVIRFFHCNNCYTNVPHCYGIRTLLGVYSTNLTWVVVREDRFYSFKVEPFLYRTKF